ncbi:tape measure protein [uncultured Catenibacterium sp.]|uniref:phage tail protein n=1 Tax=uncultured Catenibacterium sp. TaxID=286142 RepID=UPI002599F4B9|nr:tape measure protein [uncultured Catenibacterium sp.]
MASNYTLSVKIEGDESDFNDAMKRVQEALGKTDNSLKEGSNNAGIFGGVLKANLVSSAITGGLNLLKSGIQNVVGAIGSLSGDLSESSKAWQTFETNASTKHSQSEIQAVKKELQDFATATIYSSSDMASTYSQLDAVGVASAQNLVKAFGGLAAASADPAQAMKTLSQQATQMAAKPKVAWEDFKLMLEQSPAGMAAVASEMGMSVQDLITNIQAGTVSTTDFFNAVEKAGTSDKFTKMATEYKTVDQAMDGLRETAVNKLQPAFDMISQVGIGAISGISDSLDGINIDGLVTAMLPGFQALADAASNLVQQAIAWAQTADWESIGNSIADAITNIVNGISSFDWGGFFSIIGDGIGLFVDGLSLIIDNVGDIRGLADVIVAVAVAFGVLNAVLTVYNTVMAVQSAIMMANPTTWIILGIVAAIAALILIIKNWGTITETIATVWEKVKDAVINTWNNIYSMFVGIFTAILNNPVVQLIVNFVTTEFNIMKNLITGIWNGIKDIAAGAWEYIKNVVLGPVLLLCDLVTGNFTKLKEDASKIFSNLGNALSTIWNGISGIASSIWTAIKEHIGNTVGRMVDGIKFAIQKIPGIFSDIFGRVRNFVTSLPGEALRWGRDIIDGIADGIRGAIGKVTGAVKGVADKIRSFLHFSEPDVGPLSDFHTYMPDMMSGLATGIKAGIPMLQKAAGLAAGVISGGLNGTVTTDGIVGASSGSYYSEGSGNTTNYGATTINVYGAPGQDTETLADKVAEVIFDRVRREAY